MTSKRTLKVPALLFRQSGCRVPFLGSTLLPQMRRFSSQDSLSAAKRTQVKSEDLEELLSKPTWSVESLLPPKTAALDSPKISAEQLRHLLRLSALPLPKTSDEERKMLDTLSAQLHFVGEIQQVETRDVKPLRAIRDETPSAEEENTVTLKTLECALSREEVIGKHYKRIQRRTDAVDAKDVEGWDILGSAQRKSGQFFVVESERPQE